MILPNSDSEKEVKEETPNIPQVIYRGDTLEWIKINWLECQGLNLESNEFVSIEKWPTWEFLKRFINLNGSQLLYTVYP